MPKKSKKKAQNKSVSNKAKKIEKIENLEKVEKKKKSYMIECENGHKNEYIPPNQSIPKTIKCPQQVAGKPCGLNCVIIEEIDKEVEDIKVPEKGKKKPQKKDKPEKKSRKETNHKIEDLMKVANEDIKGFTQELIDVAKEAGLEQSITANYIGFRKGKKQVFRIGVCKNHINIAFNSDKTMKNKNVFDHSSSPGDRFNYVGKKMTSKDKIFVKDLIKSA
jgi:hypothetical protein